ncbi:MAG: cell wall metabolism sensor histidine kinase WalK [Candidatus Omnitrophica bacterium]|nr:cell wall metabolism sensor histidine kinase WalK [Candidatus Omnitrophota bacterium]
MTESITQESLFNNMAEGVLLLDRDGRVELINRSLEKMLRVSGNPKGRTLMETFRLHELHDLAQQAIVRGQILDFELHLPGIEKRCLKVDASVLRGPSSRIQGIMLVFHDHTRLQQLERARQEFVANVSHELRTPLSLIKGYTETLLEGAKDDPAVATHFLKIIQKHADRLIFLVEDLLTLSRLESDQVTLQLQLVDLRLLTEKVLEDLRTRASRKTMHLENRIPPDLRAQADAERLQQALFNLIENAIKYGPVNGHVTVGGGATGERWIELWVKDDGPGIPLEAQGRIFERFYRVDRSRSREQGGTGLGLAIVKHVVQSHGGKVWVKSEPGQGSTFFLTLPMNHDQNQGILASRG